jgi:hypothetical protein
MFDFEMASSAFLAVSTTFPACPRTIDTTFLMLASSSTTGILAVSAIVELPQSPKVAIYKFLESDCGMEKNEITHRFREFSGMLIDAIGPSNSCVLAFGIKRFYSKATLGGSSVAHS